MEISCPQCTSILSIKEKINTVICSVCYNQFTIETDLMETVFEANKKELVVDYNYIKAINEIPHTLIPSKMIYLTAKVNGFEIKFLLDTGAQISILPRSFVTACNLEHLIDEKYNGELKGVGSDKIIGRIHYIELELECGVYPCGFTICSNNEIGAILGIDMMRNLGIVLDFTKNKLSFENGKYELPFE